MVDFSQAVKRSADPKAGGRKRTPGRTDDLHRIVASLTEGAREAHAWVESLGLVCQKPWYIEIALDTASGPASATYSGDKDTRFHINVYPEEWGVYFCHAGHASWIRVTDQAFVHGRDDYNLIGELPELAKIGSLLAALEVSHGIAFSREHAFVHTNVSGAKAAVKKWLAGA